MKLTDNEIELLIEILEFELESMIDYPDATPFYENKNQIKKIKEKLENA